MPNWKRPAWGLVLVLATTAGLAACGDDDDDDEAPATQAPSASTAAGGGTTASSAADDGAAAGDAVDIAGFAFSPAETEVTTGGTVEWTNNDSATHTVTFDDGSADSGDLVNGDTFSHTFDTAGEFAYHCNIHPSMTGTVTVS